MVNGSESRKPNITCTPRPAHPELLEQFGEVAVVAFVLGLVPRILGFLLLHGRHPLRSRGPPATRAGRRENCCWFEDGQGR